MRAKSVLISGIGVAGPTLAYWLLEHGFAPVLVERSPRLRAGGYVIDFWGAGYDIAERMGLLPDLRAVGYVVRELRLVDSRGRRIGGFGVDVFRELTGGRYVTLPRSELSRLIYLHVKDRCETIFGDGVARIEQRSDAVDVLFETGARRSFDLAIGADGLHSGIRALAFGDEGRFARYLGYRVAAFEVEGYRPRDDLVYVSHSVPGKQVARFALREDRTLFLFIFADERATSFGAEDRQAHKAALHAEFDEVGWECPQILAALDRCDDVYFDDVSQIRMDDWAQGRVAIVGDAAFCPSLLAGQGSALGMIGAYVLAGELSRSSDAPAAALRRYQERLHPFMSAKQKAAEKLAGSFAPRTRLGLALRNQMTKALALPILAKLALGGSILDRLDLPDYPSAAVTSR